MNEQTAHQSAWVSVDGGTQGMRDLGNWIFWQPEGEAEKLMIQINSSNTECLPHPSFQGGEKHGVVEEFRTDVAAPILQEMKLFLSSSVLEYTHTLSDRTVLYCASQMLRFLQIAAKTLR